MSTMYGIRAAIATALEIGYAEHYPPERTPVVGDVLGPTDPPQRLTAFVGAQSVDAPSVACPAGRRYTLTVYVLTPLTAPGAADDDVDELLDVTLDALDAVGIEWTTATRGVWADQYPCYVLTTEVVG